MRLSAIIFLALISFSQTQIIGLCRAQEYDFLMKVHGRVVTGFLILDTSDESNAVGTIVNEFGIKAFDISYNGKKARVSNVLKPLDKWYIRRVLNKDFTFILANIDKKKDVTAKKRSMKFHGNGDIVIENRRFKIQYTLSVNRNTHETTE